MTNCLTMILVGLFNFGLLSYVIMAPQSDAFPACGPNEELDTCPMECASDYCPTSAEINSTCKEPNFCPPAGCRCKFGYRKNRQGVCIPIDNCDPVCDTNEVFKISRIPNCRVLETCISLLTDIACEANMVGGCTCKEGYLRFNESSPCMTECECPEMRSVPDCVLYV